MDPLTVVVLFIGLQLLVAIGKIVLVELLIEVETAHYGEIVVATGLNIGFYFALFYQQVHPFTCLLAAAGMSIGVFLLSWGMPKLTDLLFGWGEEIVEPEPLFPILNAWLLFFIFLPGGLGISLGIPELFIGLTTAFPLLLIAQFFIVALLIWIGDYFAEPVAVIGLDWFLNLLMAIGIWIVVNSGAATTYPLLLALVLILAVNLLAMGTFFVAARFLDMGENDEEFWKRRGYIVIGQCTIVFLAYIFPVIAWISQWIEKFTGSSTPVDNSIIPELPE